MKRKRTNNGSSRKLTYKKETVNPKREIRYSTTEPASGRYLRMPDNKKKLPTGSFFLGMQIA